MKKILKKIVFYLFPGLRFRKSGERQVAPTLNDIRADHIGRYKFAAEKIKNAENVLDAACGVGYGTFLLSELNPNSNFVGVDIEHRAVEYATKYYKKENNKFITGDVTNFSFDANSFDAVVSFETIEHLSDANGFIKSIYKILRNESVFIVSSPNQTIMPFVRENFPFHKKHYTSTELKILLEDNNFSVDEIYSQHNSDSEEVRKDEAGKYLIFIAKKKI